MMCLCKTSHLSQVVPHVAQHLLRICSRALAVGKLGHFYHSSLKQTHRFPKYLTNYKDYQLRLLWRISGLGCQS